MTLLAPLNVVRAYLRRPSQEHVILPLRERVSKIPLCKYQRHRSHADIILPLRERQDFLVPSN